MEERTVEERINTWAQIVAIVVAGIWAVYAFVYKEILVPESAPVNVSLEVAMERPDAAKTPPPVGMMPIQLRIVARNPSARTVDLLPSIAVIRGMSLVRGNPAFPQELPRVAMTSGRPTLQQRYAILNDGGIVAAGNAVPDAELRPSETISRTQIFYVPASAYDVLAADVIIPTAPRNANVDLRWVFDGKAGTFLQRLSRRNAAGHRAPIRRDLFGDYFDLPDGFQFAQAHFELTVPRDHDGS